MTKLGALFGLEDHGLLFRNQQNDTAVEQEYPYPLSGATLIHVSPRRATS